jgi:hypothetical protein
MNANWVAGPVGEDGAFELMIVTSDDSHHVVAPSPAAMTALVALAHAETVLVWDPAGRTLIAANLRGTMPWTEDAATPDTWGSPCIGRADKTSRGHEDRIRRRDRPHDE